MSAMDTANLPPFAPAGDGGMQNVTNLLTSGTWSDSNGLAHSVYPFNYPVVWPDVHHHHHYPYSYPEPGGTSNVTLHNQTHAEKPHEVVQRALKEIAQATRALRESAEAMGVPVEATALEEAIVERLRAAL